MQYPIRQSGFIGIDTSEQVAPPAALPALLTWGMQLVGLSDAGSGYHMHRPRPPYGHLLVTLGGAGTVWVDDRWVPCGEGTAYLSPANAPSAFETQPRRRWQFAWVFFQQAAGRDTGPLESGRSSLVPADARPLATAIEGLYREGIGQADRSLLDDWARLVHAYCQRIVAPTSSHGVDPLARLWVEVDTRLAANWSIASLSDYAGVSSETLRKLCVAHHHRSPMRQVAYLRMRRADMLLQSTPAKLAVIARTVGYDNVFAFSTAFRRVYAVPPSLRRKPG